MSRQIGLLGQPGNDRIGVQRYERYLPTAFDESLSLIEKVNKIIDYMHAYGELTDEMLVKWNEVYHWVQNEGLDGAIRDRLNEWLQDGTLSEIINEVVFEELNKRLDEIDDLIDDLKKVIDSLKNELLEEIKKMQPFNVKLYGAKGDGKTDDTEAIQYVLDLCRKAGGGSIFVPEGIYRVTSTLTIMRNTDFEMASGATLLRDHNSYFILNNDRGAQPTAYNGEGNILFKGGMWDCNGKEYPNATCFGIGHGDNVVIRDLSVKDVGGGSHAIEFNACSNTLVENVNFLGLYRTGTHQRGEAVQYDISKWSASFPAMGAYDNYPCKNGTVRNCYFGNSTTPGASPWPRAVGSHGSTIGIRHENMLIDGNTFDGLVERAVRLYSYSKSKVTNNIFLNCEFGIYLRSPDVDGNGSDMLDKEGNPSPNSQKSFDFVISGNTFFNIKNTVISLAGQDKSGNIENVTIANNVFRGNKSNCLYCNKSRSINFTGNSLFGNSGTNIYVSDSNDIIISNNDLENIYGSAIIAQNRTFNIAINGNVIQNADGSGIYLRNAVIDAVVNGNSIKNIGRENADSYNIKVTSECLRYIISANVCEQNADGGKSCYVTSSNKRGVNSGNIYNDGYTDSVSVTSGANLT